MSNIDRAVTTDQARQLLDDAEHTGRWEANYDDEADATRLYHDDEDVEITDGGSWSLAAAAPDLARTVINQAEQIEKLTESLVGLRRERDDAVARVARLNRMLDTADEELNNYRNEYGDL